MAQETRGAGAVEDLARHDPASGTAEQTFSRGAWGGGTVGGLTKISAKSIPVLDAPIVSGGQRPHATLSATQATLHAEACIQDAKKHIPHFRNIESYGCKPGDTNDAVMQKNAQCWDQIITDLVNESRGGGIYIPAGTWYFKKPAGDAGTAILPTYQRGISSVTPAGLTVIGEGGSSYIYADAGSVTDDLLVFSRAGGMVADVTLDKQTKTGAGDGKPLVFKGHLTAGVTYPKVFRVTCKNGSKNISITGSGSTTVNAFIVDCVLITSFARNLYLEDITGALISGNIVSGFSTAAGIEATAPSTGTAVSDITALSNHIYNYGDMQFTLNGVATFNSALHGRIKATGNFVPALLQAVDLDSVELENNATQSIIYQVSRNGIGFSKFKANGCKTATAAGNGLTISAITGASLYNIEAIGGNYDSNGGDGILVQCAGGGVIRGGRVNGVSCTSNGQYGLELNGAVRGMVVSASAFVDYAGTQTKGFAEVGAADYNIFSSNFTHGNTVAPYAIVGAHSILSANLDE